MTFAAGVVCGVALGWCLAALCAAAGRGEREAERIEALIAQADAARREAA